MKILTFGFGITCLLLSGCQHQIEFTKVAEPTLPKFSPQKNIPVVIPDWDLISESSKLISSVTHKKQDTDLVINVHQVDSINTDHWKVKLIGITPVVPIENADVLVRSFNRQALSMLKEQPSECIESLYVNASYHALSIGMNCFEFTDQHATQLGSFWNTNFANSIDVDSVRRNLKLNRKIQSVTGGDINLVFQQHLLGENHPYLKVVQDKSFIKDLNIQKLNSLQSKTASLLKWHLLVKAPKKLTEKELLKIAELVGSKMNISPFNEDEDGSFSAELIPQKKTIYFIDAPDSSDLKVRIGIRFPQYFNNGKLVSKADKDWQQQQHSLFACNTLSDILGRGSYGRLFYDLRETRGLTYGAYAYCRNQALLRAMVLWGSASQEHSGAFLEGMLRHLKLLEQQAPQSEEVDAIKLYVLGQNLISDDQDDGMEANQLLEPNIEFARQQSLQWLKTTTPQELQSMAKQYLSFAPLVVVRGNADIVMDDLQKKLPDWKISIVE